MRVLSLFDGMSCGRIALDRVGVQPTDYYASEVDKYAITVTNANWPDTQQLGCVTRWREWPIDWGSIDLLIGGSPCQGFSAAGKGGAFDDVRSALFFTYVDILIHIKQRNPSARFLLENVKMKAEWLQLISDMLGVEPVFINSALVSAQNRQRYYWCNWPVSQPEDRGAVLADILESEGTGWIKNRGEWELRNNKSLCITASYHKGVDNRGQRTMIKCARLVNRRFVRLTGKRDDYNNGLNSTLCIEPRNDGKTGAITTVQKDNLLTDGAHYRKLTPVECERLQTVPDNYTNHVSNTQRYKMLGNGWTVDVIAHIFNCLLTSGNNNG